MRILLFFLFSPFVVFTKGIVSEDLTLKNGEIELSGTLSYLKTEQKIPLILFVHGSGNVDKNGNQSGTPVQADYIKSLSETLNLNGLAFYRYDKRTANKANLDKLKNITINDFVLDVRTVLDHFKSDDRFSSIHLIGHSQGSLVAILAVTDVISSYISIAGAGRPIDKILIDQLNQQSPEIGKVATAQLMELKETDTIQTLHPFMAQILAPQIQKFLKEYMSLDPTEEIEKVSVPMLIIHGDSDLQVPVKDAKILKQSGGTKARLEIIPKMNHVLKEVNSLEENQKSYSDKNFPISSGLIKVILDFVKE